MRAKPKRLDPATESFEKGLDAVRKHPALARLSFHARFQRSPNAAYPATGYAQVTSGGTIRVNPTVRASADEWAYVLAVCLLHLGFGHFAQGRRLTRAYVAACDAVSSGFVASLKIGQRPENVAPVPPGMNTRDSLALAKALEADPSALEAAAATGVAGNDATMIDVAAVAVGTGRPMKDVWGEALGEGLRDAVSRAVSVAGGDARSLLDPVPARSDAARAWRWFLGSYPLLGGVAAAYELVEDRSVCDRLGIEIAAVDIGAGEIFVNPGARLTYAEAQFVIAHEILHAALRHDLARRGRDPFIWNVACDYVINGWLVEMEIGEMPYGVLYDPSLAGMPSTQIYDILCTDMRRLRRIATLRGDGACDIVEGARGPAVDRDEFVRRALGQGFEWHHANGRGYLPAGLVEEIQAAMMPPVPWNVELGRWFDDRFKPMARRRTWRRLSRRQWATPEVPRPAVLPVSTKREGRTFGAVIDSSGSMDRRLLAMALGSVAAYATAKEIEFVRLVFCDAQAHDEGWVRPSTIMGRMKVKGRGGTVLQPGIDLLKKADDFPESAPIMVVTDGWCDKFKVGRDHAILVPAGTKLPFVPTGAVFRIA
jgi:predicted metal-dependent peptidase